MTDYEKLKSIIDEIDMLISNGVTSDDPEFIAWKNKAQRFLIKKYGEISFEYESFANTVFSLNLWLPETPHIEFINACRSGLLCSKSVFQSYLDELEESETSSASIPKNNNTFNKVFIVHGHDGELKQSVARIVEKQEIDAIILSEQANKGRTIIEKFEDYSDVSGAICLFTADDLGKAKKDSVDNSRARQNVVLETGYFMGKLGRDHVVILADNGIEMPSDLSGVVYTDTESWKFDLLKELKAMGYTIDSNKLL